MARKKKDDSYTPEEKESPEERDERLWGGRLDRAKKFQAKYASGWDENRRLIFNESSGNAIGQQPVPWLSGGPNQVAYGWGLFEGLQTEIYVQNPEILVTARDPAFRPAAQRVREAISYDFEQGNLKDLGNLCLLDTFICGYGAIIESVETQHETDEDGERTGKVSWQSFDWRRVDPKDILFASTAKRLDLSDCPYLFIAWYPTITELRSDPAITDLPKDIEDYPEATEFTRQVGGGIDGPAERQAMGKYSGEKDPDYRTVCVWECYDKQNHEVLYISDFRHKILGRSKWPCNLRYGSRDLYPVTLFYAHPVPGRFYPRPEAELIAPQLRAINITERLIDEDSRTKFRKWITVAGIFTEDETAKITDESVANSLLYVDPSKLAEVLGISNNQIELATLDLRNLVVPIEDVQPKKDLFVRYEMLEKEIQHIVGYGPAQRGGLPSTRSAREAMMVNARQDRRLDTRKDRVGEAYRLMAMKHTRFLQRYMATERYAKVIKKLGQLSEWKKYYKDDIQGDFEFEVVAGTTTPKNTEVKKAAVLQMGQTLIPALQQANQSIRPVVEEIADVNGMSDMADRCFGNVKEKAQLAAQAMIGWSKGQVAAPQLVEAISVLLMAELSPAELEMIGKQMEQGKPMAAGGGQAPPEGAEPAPGQRGDPTPQKAQQGVL